MSLLRLPKVPEEGVLPAQGPHLKHWEASLRCDHNSDDRWGTKKAHPSCAWTPDFREWLSVF